MFKKILLVCEGKKEKKLLPKLFKIYSNRTVEVAVYNTTIYQLYDAYESYQQPYEDLDICHVINERESRIRKTTKEESNEYRIDGYSDVFLIFDMDPQDPNWSASKIIKLKNHFNDSSEYGQLFINYPMWESFHHMSERVLAGERDESFLSSTFQLSNLTQYKQQSSIEGISLSKFPVTAENRKGINHIIEHHLEKTARTTGTDSNTALTHSALTKLLDLQCDSVEKTKSGKIINTACLIFPWLYPDWRGK